MSLPPDAPGPGLADSARVLPVLDPVEIRILGCLIEKQITTPDVYPLSLNALVVACNQTTNRDPVTAYDEGTVTRALEILREKSLIWAVTGSRVPKYEHRLREKLELSAAQTAVTCVLLLRGPQTAGEIRARTGRLHAFGGLEDVESTLESLRSAEPPLVTRLPRQPGTKESRFAQLLGGEPAMEDGAMPASVERSGATEDPERIARLEGEIEGLRREIEDLRGQIADLKSRIG